MKKLLGILGILLVLSGIFYVFIPSGLDDATFLKPAQVEAAKQVSSKERSVEEQFTELNPTNTTITFSCAKTLAGKTLTMRGGWSGDFGSKMLGQFVVDEQQAAPKQIHLQIEVGSLWSEHDQLTDALKTKGFFQTDKHPIAEFESTEVRPVNRTESEKSSIQYEIEGNFSLNGIVKSLTIPARFEILENGSRLKSKFSLRRKDFHVAFHDTAGFGLLTDEDISELVGIEVVIDMNRGNLQNQSTGSLTTRPAISIKDVDAANLPATYDEEIEATLIQFQMVLVPGDPDQNILPIYVGKHEVTWDEFMPWVDGRDLDDESQLGELRALKLRPSPPYGSIDRGFGMDQRPALGMSQLSATKYCEWLSEQTGKHYRLPSEVEWERIYRLGGGDPKSAPALQAASKIAVFADNSWNDDLEDWATKPVGSTEPNTLGIYDMAGNVCEWVTTPDEERVARGGHFDSDWDMLGVGRHVEGPYWNRDYPNEPKSIWWFVNARWVGFRVVCDSLEEVASDK